MSAANVVFGKNINKIAPRRAILRKEKTEDDEWKGYDERESVLM
jgi:hypothetical protein